MKKCLDRTFIAAKIIAFIMTLGLVFHPLQFLAADNFVKKEVCDPSVRIITAIKKCEHSTDSIHTCILSNLTKIKLMLAR